MPQPQPEPQPQPQPQAEQLQQWPQPQAYQVQHWPQPQKPLQQPPQHMGRKRQRWDRRCRKCGQQTYVGGHIGCGNPQCTDARWKQAAAAVRLWQQQRQQQMHDDKAMADAAAASVEQGEADEAEDMAMAKAAAETDLLEFALDAQQALAIARAADITDAKTAAARNFATIELDKRHRVWLEDQTATKAKNAEKTIADKAAAVKKEKTAEIADVAENI